MTTARRTHNRAEAEAACRELVSLLNAMASKGWTTIMPAIGVDLAADGSMAVRVNVQSRDSAGVTQIPPQVNGIAVVVRYTGIARAFDQEAAEVGKGYDYTCPICGGEVTSRCRCFLADSKCVYGHEWHYSKDECYGPHKRPYWRRTVHQGPSNHGRGPCCVNPNILHPVTPLTNCVARGEAFARSADFLQGLVERLSARLLGQAGVVSVSDKLEDGRLTIVVLTTDVNATKALLPPGSRVIAGVPIEIRESGALEAQGEDE